MIVDNGQKLKEARHKLGWSVNDMADALRLSPANGGTSIRKMENGKTAISGPISVAVEAFLEGFIPYGFYEEE